MDTRLSVRVQPGAHTNEVMGFQEGVLRVRVSAPPHEGRANAALVKLLAERLDIAPSRVQVLRGQGSRQKLVLIQGMDAASAQKALGAS